MLEVVLLTPIFLGEPPISIVPMSPGIRHPELKLLEAVGSNYHGPAKGGQYGSLTGKNGAESIGSGTVTTYA
jgi:hypothetical protein